ncbi:DUF3097 domain-containing protein [Mycetocola zhadangensis]|uniref:DUF3097 domain-containing protein n=1 Tax=Mycetocola zhadangensis TaxID=1164595 RepID=A0A3L7IT55_9MICO|nr:DUF3097 domain-containing protein [Mycetocola zhadangensis]GGF01709.1 hypothetical protein GCM10011313_26040 [Mycetocola zhadangensis]
MIDVSYDPYGSDVLATNWRKSKTPPPAEYEAVHDLVVEEMMSGWCGAVTGIEGKTVQLEDRHGKRRVFPLGPGFLLEGTPVILVAPKKKATGPTRTASGSFAVADSRARVALPSRIYVEGRHDAELVEKVWGDDLRVEGVVVEYLGGIDDLAAIITDFAPTPTRKVGVLVDHLVPGSKESRIADAVMRGKHGGNVLVVGHPYIDVWQSVKPARVGLKEWPNIPRSIEWKKGICAALGLPNETQADIARAWQAILGRVRTYSDLEPAFLGRVEELIDFVTAPTA